MSAAILLITALLFQAPMPWVGTWTLNMEKSQDRTNPPRYKRVTTRIEPWEDGLKVSYDMVGTRGGVVHLEWTGKLDGKDYPVQGMDIVLTNAYSPVDDHSYKIIVKVDGSVASTALVRISADGKTLTTQTTETNAQGQPVTTTSTYDRQGPSQINLP